MTGSLITLENVLDSVESILSSIGSPILLAILGFGLLTLFLNFRR